MECLDLLTGAVLDRSRPVLDIAGRGIGCLLAVTADTDPQLLRDVRSLVTELRERGKPDPDPEPAAPKVVRRPVAAAPQQREAVGMVPVAAGRRLVSSEFRLRECGTYTRADLANSTGPDFDQTVLENHELDLGPLLADGRPVTNRQFAEFLVRSGYRPDVGEHFLDQWTDGSPRPGTADDPVTWVDLTDARAYARWRGARLPTEYEWQVALSESAAVHGRVRVWEWTESEQSDGHTRFAIVKGGSATAIAASDWYTDSGPQAARWSAKFLLFHPGLDRCSTIGFRCVVDAVEPKTGTGDR